MEAAIGIEPVNKILQSISGYLAEYHRVLYIDIYRIFLIHFSLGDALNMQVATAFPTTFHFSLSIRYSGGVR